MREPQQRNTPTAQQHNRGVARHRNIVLQQHPRRAGECRPHCMLQVRACSPQCPQCPIGQLSDCSSPYIPISISDKCCQPEPIYIPPGQVYNKLVQDNKDLYALCLLILVQHQRDHEGRQTRKRLSPLFVASVCFPYRGSMLGASMLPRASLSLSLASWAVLRAASSEFTPSAFPVPLSQTLYTSP